MSIELFSRTLPSRPILRLSGQILHPNFSNTSFGRTLLGSSFWGLLLEQTFGRHSAAFPKRNFWMQLFCLQLEASCLQWSFLLTVDNFSFFTYNFSVFAYNFSVFAYNFSFFAYSWSFFAYSGKVPLIRALRDCKQRSLTVSKKSSNCK